MFTLYHSNQLDLLKELLVSRIRQAPLSHPFEHEQILVQSPGMAQWLKLELAKAFGIAANIMKRGARRKRRAISVTSHEMGLSGIGG